MWSKPSQLTAVGTARPLRVAYLIDPKDCPDELLDAIFSEAYGRWGGRRTLIVPASEQGIDERYFEWLWFYDADVIYSFVGLTDEAVASIHERYAPAHLKRHETWNREKDKPSYYRIELPFGALSSLSIIPALLSRTWGFFGPITNLRILSKYWDRSESRFLLENFGFVGTSFQPPIAFQFPDLFTCLTLITEKSLNDPHMGKDQRSTYVADEATILEELGRDGSLLTLANLSEFFAPHLDLAQDNYGWAEGLSLIVGDSVDDRLLFWNGHHRYSDVLFREVTSLRVQTETLENATSLTLIKKIIQRRGKSGHQGRNDFITLRSCSIDLERLEKIAEVMRKHDGWLAVQVVKHENHAACVPKFKNPAAVQYRNNLSFRETESRETTEFKGNRVTVPSAIPWHIREARPPAGLRQGNWIVDLTIDRLEDHCPFSNVRHAWLLPRRLRIDRTFKLERQDESIQNYEEMFIRVLQSGRLSVAYNIDQKQTTIIIPDDLDAFRVGLCVDWEWLPFERGRKAAPQGRVRYRYAEPSDKGRYLLGVLERFESLPEAFDVLMNGYWRDVLLHLGAVPAEKNVALRDEFITTLRKRLGQPAGELKFSPGDEILRLAREAIRFGRKVQREERYVSYRKLIKLWIKELRVFLSEHPRSDKSDYEFYRNRRHLDDSIKHLCQSEILFQGREWQCQHCYNRNWVTIGSIGPTLECEVCGRTEPAPVSGDWHFRANEFVIEAYRDHGIEAVIYALWRLWESARSSFYFAPSIRLWEDYPEKPNAKSVEVDALAVVDGLLYLCEAKNSAGLDDSEIAQLISAAERIRPDVMLLACLEEDTSAFQLPAKKIEMKLPSGIRLEIMGMRPEAIRRGPLLPT